MTFGHKKKVPKTMTPFYLRSNSVTNPLLPNGHYKDRYRHRKRSSLANTAQLDLFFSLFRCSSHLIHNRFYIYFRLQR